MASSRKNSKEEKPQPVNQTEQSNTIDTSNMEYDALVALQAKIAKDIESYKARKKDEFKKEIKAKAAEFGFSIEEIFGFSGEKSDVIKVRSKRSDAGIKQVPYYQNPKDLSQTAFRKGKKPAWLQELADKGVDLETLRIK